MTTPTQILSAAHDALHALVAPQEAARLLQIGSEARSPQAMAEYFSALITNLRHLSTHFEVPVGPEEFLFGQRYLALGRNDVYPKVLECFIEMNSGEYNEAVLTGAIGTAKTTLALWSTAYQLYQLLLYRNPHKVFGLDPSSEILFIFQSIRAQLAKSVDFERFRHMIITSPFFKEARYAYRTDLTSELQFPRRIGVRPVSGEQTAALGGNVFGGVMDEVNFMNVIEKSKNSVEDMGVYDQAVELYNAISFRRTSRFMKLGKLPGLLCIVSSKRYPGQFTDKKVDEAKKQLAETGKTSIYVYDKRTWEIKPEGTFNKERFKVFIGSESKKPYILEEDDENPEPDRPELVVDVPTDLKQKVEADLIKALRDILGVSTLARFPFMLNADAVSRCFGKHPSVLSANEVDLKTINPKILKQCFRDPHLPRFAHVDLGLTGDAAGVAIGYVPHFVRIPRVEGLEGETEPFPLIRLDCTLRVYPPKNDEIQFHRIRALFYKLRDLGLNIQWVSYDSYQSVDSVQILRQKMFGTGIVSMDKTTLPYEITKTAFYDGRVEAPTDRRAVLELISLERDPVKGKIDHPMHGSKDLADAIAGVVYGLTMKRQTWGDHGIDLREIPDSLRAQIQKAEAQIRESAADKLNRAAMEVE